MAKVYVKWYGKVLEGELLDGDYLGMKQVRIPLDGHHPIALFMPWSVYDSLEKVAADSPLKSPNTPRSFPELPAKEQIPVMSDVLPADDREMIEKFKRENWDQERNHLYIDKLDEFYQLWREAMRPFGFVEAEAVHESCTPSQQPQPNKPAAITKGYSEITSPYPAITQGYPPKTKESQKKMRCWRCEHLDYDHINSIQEQSLPGEHFCGLHGRARVDPDGEQENLDHRGGCGFSPRKQIVELSLFD